MPHAVIIRDVGAPSVLTRTETPRPAATPGALLIRNQACAVNFIDTIIRRGKMPEGMAPELPHIPGVEGAGVVEAVGEDVVGFRPGDRVAWMGSIGVGGYASHTVVAAPYVAKVADHVDLATAAALPVNALTAWHMLNNLGRAQSGDTVLVHAAAGGVGTMILQVAKSLGLTTIASVSPGKTDFAREQGADHVLDYHNEDVIARVTEITDGKGVDLTLNPIAGETLKKDLEILAPLGTAVLFGFLAGPPAGNFAEDFAKHFQKSISVRVSDIYTYFNTQPQAFNVDLTHVFGMLAAGALRPQITRLRLEDAAEAHRRLEAGRTTGKLVLGVE